MNLKQSRIFYLSLIIIFLGVITTSIYYLLGGFKEVTVQKLGPINRTVVGKQFTSHYANDAWIEFGKQCKEMVEKAAIDGTLTVITYHVDSLKEDEISKFVGITLNSEMAEVPQDFSILEFASNTRFQVVLEMHVLVQPRPQNVEAMILNAAEEAGKPLEDFFFELRYPDGSLQVEGWVKP